METDSEPPRIFSLSEARELLPKVKLVTAEAVRRAEALANQLQKIGQDDPEHSAVEAEFAQIVNGWASRVREMGLEAKGLWLVDFDNGQGYYCWRYPEEAVTHYHGYEEGFGGRMKIV